MKHLILLTRPAVIYGTERKLQWPAHGPCAGPQNDPAAEITVFPDGRCGCSAPRPARRRRMAYLQPRAHGFGRVLSANGHVLMCGTVAWTPAASQRAT